MAIAPTHDDAGHVPPDEGSSPAGARHVGWIVALSLATGFVASLLLVAAPFIQEQENDITGAVLWGYALGWAMLAMLSVRFSDQPQRWAVVPAVFMGVAGLLLVVFDFSVDGVLSWVWPPALLALVVWMVIQAHRHLRSRSRRWLLYPVLGVLALASVGGGYETLSAATVAKPSMPGESIDVDGHAMHLHCTGTGSPTVVLQPGGGEMSSNMGWIAPRVARDTRVCVYDRPGRGWSETADTTQDAAQIVTDLHTLLERADVPGPYVLAGHSFGGLYVLTFAARYPDEVAGMVVVDTTAPKETPVATTSEDPNSYSLMGRASILVSSTLAQVGVTRLYAPTEFGELPPQSRDEVHASLVTADNLRSTIDEYVQANTSMAQAGSFTDFGDKPLVILTAGDGSDSDLIDSHERLATMSTNSVHKVIDGAKHSELIADENKSNAATEAILDVVAAIRNATPLTN